MKVIAKDHKTVEKELDLEYPVFLYFQSEAGEDELIKVYQKYNITVKFTNFGIIISNEKNYGYSENQILNNLTTEEHFNDAFEEALQNIVKLKSGL